MARKRYEAYCGTMLRMPNQLDPLVLKEAEAAVRFAQTVRERHRRRTERDNPTRASDIRVALSRLKRAMKPLRSEIGRFAHGPHNEVAQKNRQAIRDASASIQRERRKLWKMQGKR